jgi:hypothetical protein
MFRYTEIEKYLSNMFVFLIGNNASELGFSEDDAKRCLVERQNKLAMPEASTIIQFRLDNFDYWRSQRYGSSSYIDSSGEEHILELRTCKAVVTLLSKKLGDAFDSARLLVANLQNQRYNDYVNSNGRRLGIENISKMKNLSELENGTWTERIQFEITLNYLDEVANSDKEMFVRKPEDLSDLDNSVNLVAQTVK